MSVFTFTVNCPVTPTPTPTPRPTPCPCDSYILENFGGAPRTVFYLDCRGISRSIGVSPGTPVELCACSVTPETNISISNLGACGSAPTPIPTTTPTATPTPTPTFPPTPTVLPTYTVSVYAKLQSIPNYPRVATETAARFYYTINELEIPVTQLGGNITSTSCNLLGTVNVTQGDSFWFGMLSWSNNKPVFFVPQVGTSTCPSTGTPYCGTPTDGGGFSFIVTGNTNIALTVLTYTETVSTITNKSKFLSKNLITKTEIRTTLYYCKEYIDLRNTF
jgi:hypothetical protein